MAEIAHFLNFFTKLFYGAHLALAFSGVTIVKNKKDYCFIMLLLVLLQNLSYFSVGEGFTVEIYPFLIHLPLILFLYLKVKVPFFHSVFALILAFQLLSCRNWSAVFCGYFTGNTQVARDFAATILTVPLAFLFGKYLAPPVAKLKGEGKIMALLSIAPISYYVFVYTFKVYEIFSEENTQEILNFVEAWSVFAFLVYFLFSLYLFEEKRRSDIERAVLLNMQNQSEIELKRLHSQYEKEEMHRHDMRHHGNYILSLLPEESGEKAKVYIQSVLISPKEEKNLFCNNETLNLLLQFYQEQGKKKGIPLEIKVEVGDYSGISMVDLCCLLSNGLENAMKASTELPEGQRFISLKIQSKGKTLQIDLRNTFLTEPVFVGDLPHTDQEKHGYGTKSMVEICKKYHGIARFSVIEDKFCFQGVLFQGKG
ncbi:MAG: GHKL domain-containing protein [Eubacteriales bacterium]